MVRHRLEAQFENFFKSCILPPIGTLTLSRFFRGWQILKHEYLTHQTSDGKTNITSRFVSSRAFR